MTMPDHYGDLYWCVKTDLSENGEIYVHADEVELKDGTLIFWKGRGIQREFVNLALAPGKWQTFYAASIMDGSAVAVVHWKGEVSR